jgi:hypothetical protein
MCIYSIDGNFIIIVRPKTLLRITRTKTSEQKNALSFGASRNSAYVLLLYLVYLTPSTSRARLSDVLIHTIHSLWITSDYAMLCCVMMSYYCLLLRDWTTLSPIRAGDFNSNA